MEHLGDKAGAFAAYKDAMRLMPSDPHFYLIAARLARDLPEHAGEVEDLLQRCLEHDPSFFFDVREEFPELARTTAWAKRLREASEKAEREDDEPKP